MNWTNFTYGLITALVIFTSNQFTYQLAYQRGMEAGRAAMEMPSRGAIVFTWFVLAVLPAIVMALVAGIILK